MHLLAIYLSIAALLLSIASLVNAIMMGRAIKAERSTFDEIKQICKRK